MSKEKLQAFAEAVSKSEELQKQFTAIQVQSARSTAEQVAKLSESVGTPFTAEEYLQAFADSSEEISDEQLYTVAGGALSPREAVAMSMKNVYFALGCVAPTVLSLLKHALGPALSGNCN
jgi:predicted ribosomally synthesized peptide with nif11-like leader